VSSEDRNNKSIRGNGLDIQVIIVKIIDLENHNKSVSTDFSGGGRITTNNIQSSNQAETDKTDRSNQPNQVAQGGNND
jgi:hypothetical protein